MDLDMAELGKALRILNDGLPSAPGLNPRNIKAYGLALAGLDIGAITAGVLELLQTWDKVTVLPPPATVRQATLSAIARRLGLPAAEQAWAEVHHKIRLFGTRGVPTPGGGYSTIEWSHPVVGTAVEGMGGIGYMSNSTNIPTDRAHWLHLIYPSAVQSWQRQLSHELLNGGTVPGMLAAGDTDS